ncbi:MAG: hydrogenase expression/formation protein HypE [Gracilimonas sp.]
MDQTNNQKQIRLGHGSGGQLTHELITDIFVKYFDNELLRQQGDSALIPSGAGKLAFSTDSYVVDPIFFPGGNIGSLAVSGTVNDIAVTGAVPKYLSAGFIIEEGFPISDLEKIVATMAAVSKESGVQIVTGDTKVVNKGKCDKIFINTSGVGTLEENFEHIAGASRVGAGDVIIVSGFVGDHGVAILGERESLKFSTPVISDAASLNGLIQNVLKNHSVHFMRDATRGGVATVLAELARSQKIGISVNEDAIPLREEVKGICEVFGYDPLYMANEGKVVMVVPGDEADFIINRLTSHPLGKNAAIIGSVTEKSPGKVILNTEIGGQRFLDMLAGEQLPRIC